MKLTVETLTPLWTGDIDQECKRIRETGIIGSLRWWYEALVRGLGGYACDPTSNERCSFKYEQVKRELSSGKMIQEALEEHICPVCQLFGCTGWRKKFRLEIKGLTEEALELDRGSRSGLKSEREFFLHFIFLSEPPPEEKWLFKKTLWIIESFGAIGGRTTWKPNGMWGTDYGLINIKDYGKFEQWGTQSGKDQVKSWLGRNRRAIGGENNSDWFNFKFYWILEDNYLNRRQLNKVVNRDPNNPKDYTQNANKFDRWLGGKREASKKLFSFEDPKKVFGYVRNREELKEIKAKLQEVLEEEEEVKLKKGTEIMERDLS